MNTLVMPGRFAPTVGPLHPTTDLCVPCRERFHADRCLVALKNLSRLLRQEVGQESQDRSLGKVGSPPLRYLRLRASEIAQKKRKVLQMNDGKLAVGHNRVCSFLEFNPTAISDF
jgi:hypothetical protein